MIEVFFGFVSLPWLFPPSTWKFSLLIIFYVNTFTLYRIVGYYDTKELNMNLHAPATTSFERKNKAAAPHSGLNAPLVRRPHHAPLGLYAELTREN
jgi:hypothetical protein